MQGTPPGTAAQAHAGRLAWVLAITGVVLVAEVVGGLVSGSFALLADAGHMLTDAVGLLLALLATRLAARPATNGRDIGAKTRRPAPSRRRPRVRRSVTSSCQLAGGFLMPASANIFLL